MADIKQKKQKVRYEFYNFENTQIGQNLQFNLKLEEPANVRFEFVSFLPNASLATINNIYNLSSIFDTNSGIAVFPSVLDFNNNSDEIDVTQYSVIISGPGTVYVSVKHYVKD